MSLRKAVCAAAAVLCVGVFSAGADEMHPNTIGLRFGGGTLSGAELSYQKALSDINRLELGCWWGWGYRYYSSYNYNTNYLGITGFWHWRWEINEVKGLGWYIGPGGQVAYWNYYNRYTGYSDGGVYANAGGEIGIEYDYNQHGVPLLASIDIRPMLNLTGGIDVYFGGAISVRYTF
jgi:hypothetical protein